MRSVINSQSKRYEPQPQSKSAQIAAWSEAASSGEVMLSKPRSPVSERAARCVALSRQLLAQTGEAIERRGIEILRRDVQNRSSREQVLDVVEG
jgi:hypothetical protein